MGQRWSGFRIVRWVPALIWMSWIFWLSSQKALPPPPGISYTLAAIGGHFVLYGILTLLLLFGLGSRREVGPSHMGLALLIAFCYAVSDEFHQSLVPQRQASSFDVLVDMTGALAAVGIWVYGWRKIATS